MFVDSLPPRVYGSCSSPSLWDPRDVMYTMFMDLLSSRLLIILHSLLLVLLLLFSLLLHRPPWRVSERVLFSLSSSSLLLLPRLLFSGVSPRLSLSFPVLLLSLLCTFSFPFFSRRRNELRRKKRTRGGKKRSMNVWGRKEKGTAFGRNGREKRREGSGREVATFDSLLVFTESEWFYVGGQHRRGYVSMGGLIHSSLLTWAITFSETPSISLSSSLSSSPNPLLSYYSRKRGRMVCKMNECLGAQEKRGEMADV